VHSALFYSPELQALHAQQMVNLLTHRNPYTGLTYAQDPAVAFVEIVNEQSILFYTTMGPLKSYPTVRRMTAERFSDWLKARYGNQAGLVNAWGEKAFDGFEKDGFPPVGESLDKRNILPLGSPWYWDPNNLNGSQSYRRQRLLDTLEFLYSLQAECYDRYVKAVRSAGYQGEIIGSNWQAGRALSHFANLHTDWTVGTIDRHNYFGGGGARRGKGVPTFNNASMLSAPGSGMLSSGMQQVIDRPFMLSEWIHVYPNEWGAEGPAIIGAYGMGLQGWDVSFMFQNGDSGTFSNLIGRDQWDAVAPQVLGVFPAVARQVHRGDVKESEVLAVRNVHMPSLFQGKLGFDDKVKQGRDEKQLDSASVPAKALAVARTVVAFTESPKETAAFDVTQFVKDGWLVSSTGQLRWKQGRDKTDSCIVMDTPRTQAVVGFAPGQAFELRDVSIRPESRFAAVYVTAHDRGGSLASSKKLLVVAMARARNTGMRLNAEENQVVSRGTGPILLEPIKAGITLRRPGTARVTLLDHDGRRTGRSIPVTNGSLHIDGEADKTPYYLVEFD
jgi:hypothetical protein